MTIFLESASSSNFFENLYEPEFYLSEAIDDVLNFTDVVEAHILSEYVDILNEADEDQKKSKIVQLWDKFVAYVKSIFTKIKNYFKSRLRMHGYEFKEGHLIVAKVNANVMPTINVFSHIISSYNKMTHKLGSDRDISESFEYEQREKYHEELVKAFATHGIDLVDAKEYHSNIEKYLNQWIKVMDEITDRLDKFKPNPDKQWDTKNIQTCKEMQSYALKAIVIVNKLDLRELPDVNEKPNK